MIVYVYEKKTNTKIETIKNVFRISSDKDSFKLHDEEGVKRIDKENIKLVVYAF